MNDSELIRQAISARQSAYAPYSGYRVGAALLTKDGKIYTGCNIENASYSATVCAERVAFFKAVSAGEREFSAIAIAGGKEEISPEGAFPCGVCRQVMAEFCRPSFRVLVLTSQTEYGTYTLKSLLPHAFDAVRADGRD